MSRETSLSKRLLVVDDDPAIRNLVAAVLAEDGHGVHCVSSGEEALEVMSTSEVAFDLLVTDLQMPGMWGDELARQVRTRFPSLPIVVMTGHPECLAERARCPTWKVEILRKPFQIPEVCLTVRTALVSPAMPSVRFI